jgi:hypothetical protein
MPEDIRHGGAPPWDGPGAAADAPSPGGGAKPELRDLARDWITLWQSELSALAVDREAQETWHTMLALWAGAAGAMLSAAPRERPRGRAYGPAAAGPAAAGASGGPAGAAAAPGAAPAAAAPDPRDAEIERLARHVRELEARLAELEHGLRDGNGGDRRGPRRRRG